MALRVLLADHHLLVRQGLRLLLEQQRLEVVAEARDDLEAVALGAKTRPQVALIDAGLPRLGGLDAARRLRDACSGIRVILLGMIDERHVFEAFRSNVSGFLLKTQSVEDLIQAVRNVNQGGIYVAPQTARALLGPLSPSHEPTTEPLSPREQQLLQLVADGKTTKQAGAVLGITFKTAEYYRTRLMRKLRVHTTAGLVRYALQVNVAAGLR
jgi:DNA-binding NarL/FixJ family response regulator